MTLKVSITSVMIARGHYEPDLIVVKSKVVHRCRHLCALSCGGGSCAAVVWDNVALKGRGLAYLIGIDRIHE